jgi:hypothetical protein
MSSERYDDVLKRARELPADEQEQLIRQLARGAAERKSDNGKTLGECMQARGLLGMAHGPADLSTNPGHMKGFGSDGD